MSRVDYRMLVNAVRRKFKLLRTPRQVNRMQDCRPHGCR